jgi:hypothetical protein
VEAASGPDTLAAKLKEIGAARQRIEHEKQFLMRQAKRGNISEDVFEREWQSSNREDEKLAHEQDEIKQLVADREARARSLGDAHSLLDGLREKAASYQR